MSSDMTIYKCKKCGKEIGFIENFSHDHPDVFNDDPKVEFRLCKSCSEKVKETGRND